MGHRPDWNNSNFKKGSVRGFADGGEVDNREANRDDYFAPRESTVDTYEFGRYEEMQENKDRYEREESSRKAEMDRMQQEAAHELASLASARDESPKPVARSAPNPVVRDYGDDTDRLMARASAPVAKSAPKPAPKPAASGLRFGGGGAKKPAPRADAETQSGEFDPGAAGGNVGNPESGKYFKSPSKPTVRRGQAKNYK